MGQTLFFDSITFTNPLSELKKKECTDFLSKYNMAITKEKKVSKRALHAIGIPLGLVALFVCYVLASLVIKVLPFEIKEAGGSYTFLLAFVIYVLLYGVFFAFCKLCKGCKRRMFSCGRKLFSASKKCVAKVMHHSFLEEQIKDAYNLYEMCLSANKCFAHMEIRSKYGWKKLKQKVKINLKEKTVFLSCFYNDGLCTESTFHFEQLKYKEGISSPFYDIAGGFLMLPASK